MTDDAELACELNELVPRNSGRDAAFMDLPYVDALLHDVGLVLLSASEASGSSSDIDHHRIVPVAQAYVTF